MELLISVSAEGFAKGDRVIAKVGRGEWLQGVVQTSGKNVKILFDDKSSATVTPDDFKDVKLIAPKTKKNKEVMGNAEAKKLYTTHKTDTKMKERVADRVEKIKDKIARRTADKKEKEGKIKTKLSKPDPLKPKKATDAGAKDHAKQTVKRTTQKAVEKAVRKDDINVKTSGGLPPKGRVPEMGFVFTLGSTKISRPSDEFIATEIKRGRSLIDVKMTKIKGGSEGKLNLFHWKVRIGGIMDIPFTYVRRATQAELDHAEGKRQTLDDKYQERTDKNKEQHALLGIQPGDRVMVNYTNGARAELVTDINYKTGKAAIWSMRDVRGKKRRFIHIRHISSVTQKGPGYYTPPAGYSY